MPLAKNPAYKRPLAAAFVKCVRQPGKYYDGLRSNGLLLNVSATGRKYWEARVRVGGVRRTFGLGRYPDLSLLDARDKAKKLALDARAGRVPVRGRRPPTPSAPTFRDAARQAIELRSLHWTRRDVIVRNWPKLFERYVHPTIGSIAVSDLTPQDILDVLTPFARDCPDAGSGYPPAYWRCSQVGDCQGVSSRQSRCRRAAFRRARPCEACRALSRSSTRRGS